MNPVIPILENRAKLGETMTTLQILEEMSSWYYVDVDKEFQNAIDEGLIVKDGKDDLGQDLWVLANCSVKRPVQDVAAETAHVKKMMAGAVAYARERAAERARLNPQPPAEIRHND